MEMQSVISEYQSFFTEQSERNLLGSFYGPPGIPNRAFFYKLFQGNEDTFFEFLMDSSLIHSSMKCEVCGVNMKVHKKRGSRDGRLWYCGKSSPDGRCYKKKNIRYGSFFCGSQTRIATILLLSFELFQGSSVISIHKDLGVYEQCIADRRRCITDVLVDFIETNTQKVGGQGKVVEMVEFKIEKKKFNRGLLTEGQWVLGGVELGSGSCFLVAVNDREAETLLSLIKFWIEPGSEVIAFCWDPSDRLGEQGYNELIDEHYLHLTYSEAKSCRSTDKLSLDKSITFIPEYNGKGHFGKYMTWFMFRKICISMKLDPFVKFLDIVRHINWTDWHMLKGEEDEESVE